MQLRQDTRILRLSVEGMENTFASSFSGLESVSGLFEYEVMFFTVGTTLTLGDVIGKAAVVSCTPGLSEDRHFHGYVRHATYMNSDQVRDRHYYKIDLVPWLWFLTRRTDSRIFQDKTTKEIAEEVFKDFQFTDFVWKDIQDSEPRAYCVQYRESNFDFLSRLFEEEGYFYFFRHQSGKHTLVIGDSPTAAESIGELQYRRLEMGDTEAGLSGLREDADLRPGRIALNDFNFETPQTDLNVSMETRLSSQANADLEIFDYPGRYQEQGRGDAFARTRMEAQEAPGRIISATCNAPMIAPGMVFTLNGHPVGGYNRAWTVMRVRHAADNNWDGANSHGAYYTNSLEAIPDDVPYRPPRVTPRPIVDGPQTAFVVGTKGEEIDTDEYGRVKVQFHWDRRAPGDETSSCWVRVAQPLAGIRWGGLFLPRIGMEVVVDFLEGDPDRPLITGVVYNATTMPPYPLPDEKTKSTLKTSSSKGGDGFNELRFEDKAGEEQIFIHAQRDHDLRVLNDRRTYVGANDHRIVDGESRTKVAGDLHALVEGDRMEQVDGTLSLTVEGDVEGEVDGAVALGVRGEVVIKARGAITLQSGGSFIKLSSSGIVINGPMVRINSGGSPSGRRASAEAPEDPAEADTGEPGALPEPPEAKRLEPLTGTRGTVEAQASALRQAAQIGSTAVQDCGSG